MKKKYYVFENGWDIEILEDKKKAIEMYELFFDRLSKREREKVEYFRLYEIEVDKNLDDIEDDLLNYETEMIRKFK